MVAELKPAPEIPRPDPRGDVVSIGRLISSGKATTGPVQVVAEGKRLTVGRDRGFGAHANVIEFLSASHQNVITESNSTLAGADLGDVVLITLEWGKPIHRPPEHVVLQDGASAELSGLHGLGASAQEQAPLNEKIGKLMLGVGLSTA